MFNFKVLSVVLLSALPATGLGGQEKQEGFISKYGQAVNEYHRQVRARGGNVSDEERGRIRSQAFAGVKDAYKADSAYTRTLVSQITAEIARHMHLSKNAKPGKIALAKSDKSPNGSKPASVAPVAPSPSRGSVPGGRNANTGEVGQDIGADSVNFGAE